MAFSLGCECMCSNIKMCLKTARFFENHQMQELSDVLKLEVLDIPHGGEYISAKLRSIGRMRLQKSYVLGITLSLALIACGKDKKTKAVKDPETAEESTDTNKENPDLTEPTLPTDPNDKPKDEPETPPPASNSSIDAALLLEARTAVDVLTQQIVGSNLDDAISLADTAIAAAEKRKSDHEYNKNLAENEAKKHYDTLIKTEAPLWREYNYADLSVRAGRIQEYPRYVRLKEYFAASKAIEEERGNQRQIEEDIEKLKGELKELDILITQDKMELNGFYLEVLTLEKAGNIDTPREKQLPGLIQNKKNAIGTNSDTRKQKKADLDDKEVKRNESIGRVTHLKRVQDSIKFLILVQIRGLIDIEEGKVASYKEKIAVEEKNAADKFAEKNNLAILKDFFARQAAATN
ncbi:hypothetical protein [Oligoflexus tunisiensis]|uniref:hypothetical protein n=1 Tax=Oligoflexus tunisiensis TaxID=708132 RepID=UPI00114CE7D8|nr:hypothetical protein [Oligoflexus tunisiensis]